MYPVTPGEETFYWALLWGLMIAGTLIFLVLQVVTAPYGRHARRGWGPTIPSRVAWIFMESPSVLVFAGVFALGTRAFHAVPLAFLAIWQFHYLHRAFVYPLCTYRDRAHRTAFWIAGIGFVFNVVNAYLNGRWSSELSNPYGLDWLTDPRFLLGIVVFGYGYYINRSADAVLRRLNREARGYQIPRGGWYERVSCPNYFGELLEWLGWAIATWSWAGFAFLWFTACNLIPRAIAHHRWYRQRFPDYPTTRRAVIPGLL